MMKIEKVPQFSRSEIAFDKLKMQIHPKFNANYIQRKNGSTILIGIVQFAGYLILIGALWNADSNPSAYYLTAVCKANPRSKQCDSTKCFIPPHIEKKTIKTPIECFYIYLCKQWQEAFHIESPPFQWLY